MDYEQIRWALDADGVATLTLHRPERRNAWTRQMGVEFRDALNRADLDDAVRAVVVTGAGRDFCVGADVGGDALAAGARREPLACWRVRKPIIGALRGACAGVGATLPLQFDVRIAGASARFAFVFVRRGLVPEAASTWLLPRLVGMSRATEILLAGRTVPADDALAMGLVSQVVADDDVLATAQALARDVARAAPVAVALTKRLLWRMASVRDADAADALDATVFGWAKRSPDAREGIRAFGEKRDPVWTMRPSELPDLDDLEDA
jgi:enoyl-CoA hydratase/carnithine racemase